MGRGRKRGLACPLLCEQLVNGIESKGEHLGHSYVITITRSL